MSTVTTTTTTTTPGDATARSNGIGVIDCSRLLEINQATDASELAPHLVATCMEIGEACRRIGFFVAAPNHGVPGLREAEAAARRFFALPAEERERIAMSRNATYRGYSALGGETTMGKQDFKCAVDLGTHHPENAGVNTFMGANQYPDNVPGFREAAELYHDGMRAFGRAVMRALAVYLGVPLDSMTTPVGAPTENHLFRFLCYPPAPKNLPGRVQGIGEHTDYGMLAMVVATGGGLEARNTDGEWVPAPFIPHSIVVNIGDMVETFTNGLLKSTWHRVLHNNDFTRFSFPFFYEPAYDATIAPLGLFGQDRLLYPPINYADHVRTGTAKSFPNHIFSKLWAEELEARRSRSRVASDASDDSLMDIEGISLPRGNTNLASTIAYASHRETIASSPSLSDEEMSVDLGRESPIGFKPDMVMVADTELAAAATAAAAAAATAAATATATA